MKRSMRTQRGQGTVELALATLVFVTILLAGIQFAEMGFLSLKVQEASNFALWTTTTRRVHFVGNLPDSDQALTQTVNQVPDTAENRYRDFHADRGGNGSITQVLIRGSRMELDCNREDRDVRFRLDDPPGIITPRDLLRPIYATEAGGVSCNARASLDSIRNPQRFAQRGDRGGFFTQTNNKLTGLMTVCSLGTSRDGTCPGRYPILLGDWALLGNPEGAALPFDQRMANRVYYDAAETIYQRIGGGGGNAAVFANHFAGGTPPGGNFDFHMSYIPFPNHQNRPSGHGFPSEFHTSGVERGTAPREGCWFGIGGC